MSEETSTTLLEAPESLELGVLELGVLEGPDSGRHWRIGPGRVRIGSGPRCDVVLSDPAVSRIHFEIDIGRLAFRIHDLESTNGTFIEAVRVFDASLAAATLVRAGNSLLRLELIQAPGYLELSRSESLGSCLGASPAMRRVYAMLERAAISDDAVLLRGETGTSKEAVARALPMLRIAQAQASWQSIMMPSPKT